MANRGICGRPAILLSGTRVNDPAAPHKLKPIVVLPSLLTLFHFN
jgi:hypothetical protein